MKLRTVVVCAIILAAGSFPALATPEPSTIPVAWELSLEPSQMMRIQADGRTYWYMLYTVINNTGQDIDFLPEIVRVSEIETEVPADKVSQQPDQASRLIVDPAIVGLNARVYQAIAQRHARTHAFMVTPVEAIGRLLQGRDNARTSVAVFKELDPRVSKFTIYFGGLSGEKIVKPNPMYDAAKASRSDQTNGHASDDESNPKLFVLRKTLAIPYTLPGDVRSRATAQPALGRMTWVMR